MQAKSQRHFDGNEAEEEAELVDGVRIGAYLVDRRENADVIGDSITEQEELVDTKPRFLALGDN